MPGRKITLTIVKYHPSCSTRLTIFHDQVGGHGSFRHCPVHTHTRKSPIQGAMAAPITWRASTRCSLCRSSDRLRQSVYIVRISMFQKLKCHLRWRGGTRFLGQLLRFRMDHLFFMATAAAVDGLLDFCFHQDKG